MYRGSALKKYVKHVVLKCEIRGDAGLDRGHSSDSPGPFNSAQCHRSRGMDPPPLRLRRGIGTMYIFLSGVLFEKLIYYLG